MGLSLWNSVGFPAAFADRLEFQMMLRGGEMNRSEIQGLLGAPNPTETPLAGHEKLPGTWERGKSRHCACVVIVWTDNFNYSETLLST